METAPVQYAIVDGAVEEGLLDFLNEVNPPHCCLYAEPIQPDLVALAPYLVEVVPEVEAWLSVKASPWGIYLTTYSTMNVLRQHLRRYLQVLIPDETKPVLLRFYDPRNIWDFLSVLSEWEKYLFVGPVDKITTFWNGEEKCKTFHEIKDKFPVDSGTRRKIMKVSRAQMDALILIFEERYIESLAEKLKSWGEPPEKINKEIIGSTLQWLRHQGITDDRSIRGLFYLFHSRECLTADTIPEDFRRILGDGDDEGVFKAETLLIRELGNVPL
ncbi:DUF4123 domain-containing protein [Escherichia coli]|uniref:DUF4123 domain-containing protein n=3 Tax=Escherichia coli TaxID=562 RepID=UPI000BE825AC|nr:DUF4123 domain-containing protein [Escherichia coli]EFJ7400522.1 DUF4123 domain-containing protein [Escherichia coli]EHL6047263.1 DUF4123 domain-containing protein [Escherichia coli]EJH5926425.1 DUF4123 domain-containing protein [Escherichia coli]ELH6820262.1 DUF4123 domain-containing protein [Escherichia coli]HBA9622699.1 DUF4123 domain-containing protein [Escherichia coli]